MTDAWLSVVGLPIAISVIMFGMGMSLTPLDFRRIVEYPKAVAIGMTNQLILLPIIGFLIALTANVNSILAVGVVMVACCPGGATSNLITFVSKGDIALSITLTAITSFLSVLTLPIIVNFALRYFAAQDAVVQLPIFETVIKILLITVIPVCLGMTFRYFFPKKAERFKKPARIISAVFFVLVLLSVAIIEKDNLITNFPLIWPAVCFLNISTMALGYFIAKMFNLNLEQRISITIESGIQNATLAIVIATTILMNSEMAIPAGVYSVFMFLSGGAMMAIFGTRKSN